MTKTGHYISIIILTALWIFINYIPLVHSYIEEKNMSLISLIILFFLLISMNVYYKKVYNIKTTEIFVSFIIAIFILFAGSSLMVSVNSARNHGMVAECESNLKELAVAVENYYTGEGYYPPDLETLLKYDKNITLKELPVCNAKMKHYWPLPYRDKSPCYSYILSDKTGNYTIWCNSQGIHRSAGLSSDACWPQYNSARGLIINE